MSRLQAGALTVQLRPVALDEVVPLALDDLGPDGAAVLVDVPDDLPQVLADPGLLERVVANLVAERAALLAADARRSGSPAALADRVELRVVDRGPGHPGRPAETDLRAVPAARRHRQHHRRRPRPRAVARADRGDGRHADPEETPGGGLTMVVALPVAHAAAAARRPGPRERSDAAAGTRSS